MAKIKYGASDRTRTCMVGICSPLRSHSATDAYIRRNDFVPLMKWFGRPLLDVVPSLSLEGGIRIYICIPIYTIYYKKSMIIFHEKEMVSIPLLQWEMYHNKILVE